MDELLHTDRKRARTDEGGVALLAGGVAAMLASACCVGPLLLLTLGFSGAWIGSLTALEDLRPLFVVASLAALGLAARRIWRPDAECLPGQVCAVPAVKRLYKGSFVAVALLVVLAFTFPLIAPWFY
ncbi:MAG: mercuric transporter MerT family protein [Methylibium sp.]